MTSLDEDRLRSKADRLTSASLCDAMAAKFDHRAHIIDMVSPAPGVVLFGPAATISFLPNRRDVHSGEGDRFEALLDEATQGDAEGRVLVLGSSGNPDEALVGGKKAARIEAAGFSGLLADGRVRDMEEIADFEFACYCWGETVRAAGDRVTPYAAGVPVVVDELTIMPGDWVFADTAGAVVIPAIAVAEIVEDARRIEEQDAATVKKIRSGR
jgi:4-hydroxy-4-methyl-2-oxoglutarate aldolase